ncbi:hypothetical protein B2G71_04970 [Novosphingobium sp. PC22D]|uniref:FecR family protein n=1 Tax=Novosphingobium sp. PC22D TaxID=1962403 RepID=UPI000BEF3A7C|nr:FecR domain-containing protein [Novosphingobium sp. PC22D]PEQ13676.1 hypothetical protein B2G71_04970 [Novosphingobium sp. PC22D]
MTPDDATESDPIEAEAAEWVVRAAAPDFSDTEGLQRFRATSPRHSQAFLLASQAWDALAETDLCDGPDPVPVRAGHGGPTPWKAALAASVALAVGLASYPHLALALRADLRTSAGERHTARLPDGSRVVLDARTAIELAYSDEERRIVLLEGQALFEARPAAQDGRPFVVESEGGTVRALGTRFTVNDLGEEADVVALEHRIEISADDGAVMVGPGSAVRFGAHSRPVRRDAAAAVGEAWQRDRLMLDRVRLSEAAEMLSRYSETPVRYWGGGARDRLVSGAFSTDDIDGATRAIASEFGLQITRIPLVGTILH